MALTCLIFVKISMVPMFIVSLSYMVYFLCYNIPKLNSIEEYEIEHSWKISNDSVTYELNILTLAQACGNIANYIKVSMIAVNFIYIILYLASYVITAIGMISNKTEYLHCSFALLFICLCDSIFLVIRVFDIFTIACFILDALWIILIISAIYFINKEDM